MTVIIDLFDRKVIGWSFSRSLKAAYTTIPAWKMAVRNRLITRKLIFHSDRGIQYACNEFKNLLASYKLVERSMCRKGDCWDNMQLPKASLKHSKLSMFFIKVTGPSKKLNYLYLNTLKPGTM